MSEPACHNADGKVGDLAWLLTSRVKKAATRKSCLHSWKTVDWSPGRDPGVSESSGGINTAVSLFRKCALRPAL